MTTRKRRKPPSLEPVAGNGLLDRRALLGSSIAFVGAMTTGASLIGAAAEPLKEDPWSQEIGTALPPNPGAVAV
jgi:sulfane dehydrogenase subunit SoxC